MSYAIIRRLDRAVYPPLIQRQKKTMLLAFIFKDISSHLQNKAAFNSTLNLINDVSEALMYRMVVDQDPHHVSTDSMDIVLYRLSPKSLKKQTDIPGIAAGFKVPIQAIAADKANDTSYVDAMVRTNCLNMTSPTG